MLTSLLLETNKTTMPDITINCGGETLHLRKGHYPNKAIAVYTVTEDGTRGVAGTLMRKNGIYVTIGAKHERI